NAAVELVGAGLGDRVDDAAGRAAVLGHVPASFDPDLFEELDRQGRAVEPEAGVAHRQAVDVVLVLGRGGAADAGAVGVAAGARGRLGDRLERAVGGALAGGGRDRDPLRHLLVDRQAGGAAADVDRGRGDLDLDDLASTGADQRDVDANRGSGAQLEAGAAVAGAVFLVKHGDVVG